MERYFSFEAARPFAKTLEVLFLQAAQITEIPDFINELTSLQELYVDYNRITYISPNLAKLNNLRVLDLDDTCMNEIPEFIFDMTALEELWLGSNKLRILPKEISKLKNLKKLDLSFNKIGQLPKEIYSMKNLEVLGLEGNPLKISPNSLRRLSHIDDLSVEVYEDMPSKEFKYKFCCLTPIELRTEMRPPKDVLIDFDSKYFSRN